MDEWVLAPTHDPERPRKPRVDGGEHRLSVSLQLGEVVAERGLADAATLFVWLLHRVYGGAVDDRHFEVVFRAMMVDGRVVGVTRAASDPAKGLLRTASFRAGLQVLATAALQRSVDPLIGYKERLMTGKALRG
jgi:hypothetical protein